MLDRIVEELAHKFRREDGGVLLEKAFLDFQRANPLKKVKNTKRPQLCWDCAELFSVCCSILQVGLPLR